MARRDPVFSALQSIDKWTAELSHWTTKAEEAPRRGGAKTKAIKKLKNADRQLRAAETRLSTSVSEATPKRSYKSFTPTVERKEAARKEQARREQARKKREADRARIEAMASDEYEIGLDYSASVGASRGSQVMINIRVSREDGGKMQMKEAQEVARLLHAGATTGELGDYYISGIDWARPNRSARQGDESDVANFSAILRTVGLKHWRIGGVKK